MSLTRAVYTAAFNGDKLSPKVITSTNYKHWVSTQDLKRCLECADNHGKIWYISETPSPKPPLHPRCRCAIERMKSIIAGTATINGINGAYGMRRISIIKLAKETHKGLYGQTMD